MSQEQQSSCIVSTRALRSFVASIDALRDEFVVEAKLDWTVDGLSVTAVDPANVLMVDVDLPTETCESYDLDEECTIGVATTKLMDVLDLPSADDLVTLTYSHETRQLYIDGPEFSYQYAPIDPDTVRTRPDIPDLDYAVDVSIDQGHLRRAVQASDMVSKHITLGSDGEAFMASADGDTDSVDLEFDEDRLEDAESFASEASIYSLGYVENVVNALSGEVRVRIAGTEMPLRVDSEESHGRTTYVLAPRVKSR